MTSLDIVALAHSLQLEELENAWEQALADPGPIEPYQKAIDALCSQDAVGTALRLGAKTVDVLAEKGRPDAAVELAMTLVRKGAHNDALGRRVLEIIKTRHGGEEWFPLLEQRAEVSEGTVNAENLALLVRLLGYMPGNVVFHAAGWGEGSVEAFDPATEEARVRFADGREQDFPLSTLMDSFKALPAGDLRAMRLQDIEELQRLAKDEPSALIRKAGELYRGRISSGEVKKELTPQIIPQKKWAGFWKKAKAAAAHDPWLLVEGSATRPVFVVRKKPVGLVEEARKTLKHSENLGQSIAILRDYLDRTADGNLRSELLDMAGEQVEKAIGSEKANPAHVLDGLLLLEGHGRKGSIPAAREVRTLLFTDEKYSIQRIEELTTQESREQAVQRITEALGEGWQEDVLTTMTTTPASVVERVVDLLVENGHGERLVELWDDVAPYPRRHPMLTYLLCRLYADGTFEGHPRAPSTVQVARVALHLARVLTEEKRGSPALGRLLTRTISLLTGRRQFLARAMEEISRSDLATYLGITERGGSEFPGEISAAVLRAVADKHPDLTSKPDKPFWETDFVFVTARGLEREREAYRVLVEEKIPANSKAIGSAASMGDLSENSEWESAMEEQRNLTGRASEMDEALRSARLIEHQEIPDEVVAPGVRVQLRAQGDGSAQTLTILGPWDCVEDGIINYKAPLAQALLGRKIGDTVELPGSDAGGPVTIEAIEKVI